jgi:predicted phage tail protein
MDTLRTIRLYGRLGSKFGRVHRLAVESIAEAVRALCVMLPGFEQELRSSRERGVNYACFLGKTNIAADQLNLAGGIADIRIAPVHVGAKRAGGLQVIVGVVLIVVGAIFSAYGFPTVGAAMMKMGAVMILGGVIQMLSPQQLQHSAADGPNNGASYNFNGPVNTTAQGNPVPLLYGHMLVGSAVISAGILAENQAYWGGITGRPAVPRVNTGSTVLA